MSPSVAWEGAGGTNHEDSPTAILKEDGLYKLWYHGISGTTRQIGYAESVDGLNWTKYAGNPVLTPGPAGAWDADTVCEPRVIHTGNQYVMFYTHCAASHGIGLATSNDGKTWTKYAGNPVLTVGPSGAWDSQQVSWGEVYYDGQRFYMWYPGHDSSANGFSLGVATSTDGKTWTRSPNNPVMTPPPQPLGKGDDLGVESSPTVLRLGDTMRVYYGGFRSCCPEDTTVCLATTTPTGVANRAPLVDAGRDQTIAAGDTATLDGTVMDDDVPVPLASVQVTWSKQSGPGTVSFANANAVDTTATFSAPGMYVAGADGVGHGAVFERSGDHHRHPIGGRRRRGGGRRRWQRRCVRRRRRYRCWRSRRARGGRRAEAPGAARQAGAAARLARVGPAPGWPRVVARAPRVVARAAPVAGRAAQAVARRARAGGWLRAPVAAVACRRSPATEWLSSARWRCCSCCPRDAAGPADRGPDQRSDRTAAKNVGPHAMDCRV